MESAVANGNGTIDYDEFITATMQMNRMDRKEHLYTAFQYFDKDYIGEAHAVWKAEFNKVFALEFPFIKKIADSHLLPLGDLMNIFPDSPIPQGLLSVPSPTVEAPTGPTAERNVNAS
ncbi:calcium-dependent protein kinase 14 [Artemisia annua]|uniref:Calcium-dependent protein kinase 14 n=1 Tax=Artemisia annua TaxID=35608 RepID=A0A2U1LVM0_ARTAN|nr:calcium-dependent protein kinase 14 [Artemisia annua]